MTKFILSLLFSMTIALSANGQQAPKLPSCFKKVQKLYNDYEYHKALLACQACIEKYPESARLYYESGLLNFYLNHQYAAAFDFKMALEKGILTPDFKDGDFLRWMSDTVFIIQNITDSLIFQTLDPELNYRKRHTMADTLQGMLTPERTCFDVTYENLTVKIIPETKSIEGSNEITFNLLNDTKRLQFDLYAQYEITALSLDSVQQNFSRRYNAIFVDLDSVLRAGEKHTVQISYKGIPREAPNPPWDGGFVWKENEGRFYIGVACEHLGASAWWPNKDHLSDKTDSINIHILAPSGYDVVANGNLLMKAEMADGYDHHLWHVSYPINNYNVTFYVGDFVNFNETYTNAQGKAVQVDYYVLEKNLAKAKTYYAGTTRIIEVFEELFGDYAFPNDGLAYIESPFAGMEHQSAIAIGGDYGKDSVYDMVGNYDLLVIHETAHEWWGNAVAVGDMADVWINEGFATYSEHLFIEKEFGREKYIKFVADNMQSVSNIWPMVGQRNVNDNAFLGQDVYYKGAAMLHSLRCIYDDDKAFFSMIKAFYRKAKLKISTSQDFVDHAKKYSDKPLDAFFKVFLYQNSPPTLEYAFQHKSDKLVIKYRWRNVPYDFEMPFLIVFNGGQGFRMEATKKVQEMSFDRVKSFYLFNPFDMDERVDTKNAFTYYFADWKNFDEL